MANRDVELGLSLCWETWIEDFVEKGAEGKRQDIGEGQSGLHA
jgi:hypothetical protein